MYMITANTHIYNNLKYNEEEVKFDIEFFDIIMNYYSIKNEEDIILMIDLYYKFSKKMF
jgi:hypothetical protein